MSRIIIALAFTSSVSALLPAKVSGRLRVRGVYSAIGRMPLPHQGAAAAVTTAPLASSSAQLPVRSRPLYMSIGPVRGTSRSTPPRRAVPHMSDSHTETSPPEGYEPKRACELMIESLGLSYGAGHICDDNYRSAMDIQNKTQLVLSYDKDNEHATVVFRGTEIDNFDDVLRDIQYLTTSTHCFKKNEQYNSRGGDVYGTTDGTGLFEALKSSACEPFGPQVHRGFAQRALTYSRWVQDKLREDFPPESPTDSWNEGGIGSLKQLYVTGHSLGGAAALAFAYWVKLAFNETNPHLAVHVYVFSAPNIGNAAWATEYNAMLGNTTFQHNYGPDVVPQYPPWLWKVGNVVSLEHKTMEGLTGKPTSSAPSAEPSRENISVHDASVNFPVDYHLDLGRVFVPYFEHLEPGSAVKAWKPYTRMRVMLEKQADTRCVLLRAMFPSRKQACLPVSSFAWTDWGQRLMPAKLKNTVYENPDITRKPHFTMEDINATWSFPSRTEYYKGKNAAFTVINLAVQLYVLAHLAEPLLAQAPGILLAGAPLAALMLGTPAVAVAINLLIQRNQA